jgi:integrase/recombinase XerD
MKREFLKELRGDSRREAIDIYNHIDPDELRKAYLAAVPRLGVA